MTMQLPKVTTASQSRFTSSPIATIVVFTLFHILSKNAGSFAYALDEVDGLTIAPRNDAAGKEVSSLIVFENQDGDASEQITKRAFVAPSEVSNNQFKSSNINPGETQYWVFTKESVLGTPAPPTKGLPAYLPSDNATTQSDYVHKRVELKKRSNTVYVSLNTCLKPSLNITAVTANSGGGGGSSNSSLNSTAIAALEAQVPPLTVYVSTSADNKNPGPDGDQSLQSNRTAEAGYMGTTVTNAQDAIYISVSAPNTTLWTGGWNYNIAASIDAFFHSVVDADPNLFFVDSDINSALLITNNLTQSAENSSNYNQWMDMAPPYTIFANNVNDSSITGLERSYCALSLLAQVRDGNQAIHKSMTSRGLGNKPKEQFYMTYLNSSSQYYGILGMTGNSTDSGNGVVGGGGTVWRAMNFSTKADQNCALLYNLDFCSEVAYAVPSNPKLNVTQLGNLYDQNAQAYYLNFTNSLSLIQCSNTSSTNLYSLAVNCDQCATAYKQWLCAVTIPRCADWSSTSSFLMPRNAGQAFLNGTSLPTDNPFVVSPVTNASRNSLIDSQIQPGPYKEILPCTDLCNDLVRTCPSALQFRCPTGKLLNDSYGYRASNGDITCSYLGAAYYLNGALGLALPGVNLGLFLVGLWTMFWLV